jgi:hypothetical protein
MVLVISILLLKISNLFSNCAQRSPWTGCLATPDTDTLCDCDGNIMIFGLVLCYTRWMQASTCLSKNWDGGLLLPSQIQRCTTVVEFSNVLSSDVHLWEWGHDQHLRERIHACLVLFVDVRACESNSGSHVAREPIQHSLGSKPEQNKKWYVLLLLAWQLC